ncbi:MAG: BamA/TamA family outer membrane protein [Paucibacter sp.]|nr:BamA/TamA family outer membrane protein [Roseateles sp.]
MRGLKGLLLAAALLGSRAQALELRIEAPSALKPLLEQHMDLARVLREKVQLTELEIERLSAEAPAQVRELLQTEGYFDAKVSTSREGDTLVFTVDPGPRSRIDSLSFEFSGEIKDQPLGAQLRNSWGLPVGQAFTQAAWSTAKLESLARARDEGYARASWEDTAAKVDPARQAVSLALAMDSGPLYHLGELRIEGLTYQSAEIVQRLAGFKPGTPYSARRLQDFQERLQKTQLFDGASVELQPEDDNAAAAPVLVRLRESPRQQATLGLGYHANTGQGVTLDYLNRRPLDLPIRARSKLIFSREQQAGELELSSHPQPDMARNLVSARVEEDRTGQEVLTNTSFRVGRVWEYQGAGHDERFVYFEGLRALQTTGLGRDTSNALSANIQWTRRRLDDLVLPSQGLQGLLLIGAGAAQSSSASTGPFGRGQFKLQAYDRLPGNWYGTARIELDQVLARSAVGVPQALLFREGGDDSVRGYGYQDLGPRVNGQAVGGRVGAAGSVEAAHALSPDWPLVWGAAFVDAGNAADRWSSLRPQWGAGLGLRVRSPIGPLRLDVARGFQAHQWRLHFSVGVVL